VRVSNSLVAVLLVLIVLPGSWAYGQAKFGVHLDDVLIIGEKGQALHDYLTSLEEHGFHGSVLVAEKRTVLLHNAYGTAFPEQDIKNHSNTVFSTGTVTRQFTAACIAMLEQELVIETNDPLDRFFDDVPLDKKDITLHHLLTNSSGLPSLEELGAKDLPLEDLVPTILSQPLKFPVGQKSEFSNSDYYLLARVVEIVSGQPFETYLRQKFFIQLWMQKSGMKLPFYVDTLVARSLRLVVDEINPTRYIRHRPYLAGSSGVISTVGDLYRWLIGVNDPDRFEPDYRDMMFEPYMKESGSTDVSVGYGWRVQTSRTGDKLVFQTDQVEPQGWGCAIYHYQNADVMIIVLTNKPIGDTNTADVVATNLSAILFGDREVAAPTADAPLDTSIPR